MAIGVPSGVDAVGELSIAVVPGRLLERMVMAMRMRIAVMTTTSDSAVKHLRTACQEHAKSVKKRSRAVDSGPCNTKQNHPTQPDMGSQTEVPISAAERHRWFSRESMYSQVSKNFRA